MSVDLWTAYLDTALDIYQTSEDFEWTIKSIYERAIDAAGLEFRSDKLWEHFISWTSNNGRLSDATKIYDQLLRTATQMYYQNWENFKKHVEDNETQSIIPLDELESWKGILFATEKLPAVNEMLKTPLSKKIEEEVKPRLLKDNTNEEINVAAREKLENVTDSHNDGNDKTELAGVSAVVISDGNIPVIAENCEDFSNKLSPVKCEDNDTDKSNNHKDDKSELMSGDKPAKTMSESESIAVDAIDQRLHERVVDETTEDGSTKCTVDSVKDSQLHERVAGDEATEEGSSKFSIDSMVDSKLHERVAGDEATEEGSTKCTTDNLIDPQLHKNVIGAETKAESTDSSGKENELKADEINKLEAQRGERNVDSTTDNSNSLNESTEDSNKEDDLKKEKVVSNDRDSVLHSNEHDSESHRKDECLETKSGDQGEIITASSSAEAENNPIPAEKMDITEGNSKVQKIANKDLTIADWNLIKSKFIEDREQVYQKTYEQITKRWYFEEKIRRPYFHVKPLEKSQLLNWREYLDMEISEGDFKRIKSLFERCLIACALYEEFWIRYATYLESQAKQNEARLVWENACTIHLPHCSELHWRWSLFEERQANVSTAIEVISRGCRECAGDVKLAVRRLSLLRRSQSISFEALRAEFESTIEKFASENIACASVLSLKYSRLLDREKGDREHAERVLREAIARDETNERLYMQLVDLNYRQPNFDWRACDRVLTWMAGLTSLPLRLRLRFCKRRYEILEETSNDIQAITSALQEFEEMERDIEVSNELDAELSNVKGTNSVSHAADGIDGEPASKRSRTANTGADVSDNLIYSYDSYHQYGASGNAGGDPGISATSSSQYDSSGYGKVQNSSGSNPQAYAAAAAAAAANAAYPNYSANGNVSWDSYYNSYYGYYAGYYGTPGEHHDWQGQDTMG